MSIVPENSTDTPESSTVPLDRGHDLWSSDRPETRTFVVTAALSEINRESRVGLTLDRVIAAERDDYHDGMAAHRASGGSLRDYIDEEEDRTVWEGGRVAALLRPREDGDLEILEFVDATGRTLGQPRRTVSPISWVVASVASPTEVDPIDEVIEAFSLPSGTEERPSTIGDLITVHQRILAELRQMDGRKQELEEDLEILEANRKRQVDLANVIRADLKRGVLNRQPYHGDDEIGWGY